LVEDARQRTKTYLETWLLNANLTKDDNAAQVTFIVSYADADYPLARIFTDKAVDLIFCVGTPDSTALPVGVGYEENVPITTWCINKVGITGTKLRWKAEAELRRIVETQPTGSLRTLQRLSNNEKSLGSTVLYSTEYVLRYKRYA
jgi:hypothetical protein